MVDGKLRRIMSTVKNKPERKYPHGGEMSFGFRSDGWGGKRMRKE